MEVMAKNVQLKRMVISEQSLIITLKKKKKVHPVGGKEVPDTNPLSEWEYETNEKKKKKIRNAPAGCV